MKLTKTTAILLFGLAMLHPMIGDVANVSGSGSGTGAATGTGTRAEAGRRGVDAPGINIEFGDLSGWEPIEYLTVSRGSSYAIHADKDVSHLVASSENGISGIVYAPEINILQMPQLTWRWQIGVFPEGATPTTKRLDDFALRIYVMFFDPNAKFSLGERIAGMIYKTLFGYDPPSQILAYVWSERPFDAPFQSLVNGRVVYLDADTGGGVGEWRITSANVRDDYRRVFGVDPPATARVGVISDSDSTGGESRGAIDFIRFTGL
jgi:hypothetical protein